MSSIYVDPDRVDAVFLAGEWVDASDGFIIGQPIIVGGGNIDIDEPWFGIKVDGAWIEGPLTAITLVREKWGE